ncbi:hypothetical protein DJ522_05520 [Sulfolobus sp. F3]|nr:hypothetical protein DJ522_05520 [Sulfolobus sp. F3]
MERVYQFDRDSIIKWMKNRPSAEIKVIKDNTENDVVVVIPTMDVNSGRARQAKSIFSPLPIVFVESRGKFFNYARSVNLGVLKAIESHPKWVVISNDDMHKVDNATKLIDELSTATKGMVLASPSSYHTYRVSIVKPISDFVRVMHIIGKIFHLPPAEVYGYLLNKYGENLKIKHVVLINSMVGPFIKLSGEIIDSFLNAGSFLILNRRVINGKVFDETFINGYEDVYLSMKMREDLEIIKFRINEDRGSSLGFNKIRFLKLFVNEVYMNYLLERFKF